MSSFALLAAMTTACSAPPEERLAPNPGPDNPALFDLQTVRIDAAAPQTRFDGHGSLLTGAGWSPPEKTFFTEEREIPFSWVEGTKAELFFEPPPGPLDLVAIGRRYDFEAAPPQTLRLFHEELEIGQIELGRPWQEIRLPLPELPRGRLARLELRLSYATRPAQVGAGADNRELAAAFVYLAVQPRPVEPATGLAAFGKAAAPILDAEARRLTLRAGDGLSVPLRGPGSFHLALGAVSGRIESDLIVDRVTPLGEVLPVWRGAAREAAERGFEGPLDETGLHQLRIRRAAGSSGDEASAVELELPAGFAWSQPTSQPDPAPPIFVYLIDTLRADALGTYGYPRPTSPRIDAFARDAVVYEQAWSPSAWTLPAVTSLMTGVYPFEHGVMRGTTTLTEEGPATLAGRLGEAGYRTLGISQSYVAGPAYGLAIGFDRFLLDDQLNGHALRSDRLRRYLLAAMGEANGADRPTFAYLHGVAPHAPYSDTELLASLAEESPPRPGTVYSPAVFQRGPEGRDPAEVAHLRARYDGEVHYADREFGRFLDLLEHLGLYEQSVVVLVSDHGEEFGEHGGFDHGRTLFEEMIRVPLLVKYPGNRWAGQRVAERVSTLDLTRTLAELGGAEPQAGELAGRSLLPSEVRGRSRRAVFSEVAPARGPGLAEVDLEALAIGVDKCLHSALPHDRLDRPVPPWRFFDLEADPGERAPTAGTSQEAKECRKELNRWRKAADAAAAENASAGQASEEQRQRLRALGYIE